MLFHANRICRLIICLLLLHSAASLAYSSDCSYDYEIRFLYQLDFSPWGIHGLDTAVKLEKEFYKKTFWDSRICNLILAKDTAGNLVRIKITPLDVQGLTQGHEDRNAFLDRFSFQNYEDRKKAAKAITKKLQDQMIMPSGSEFQLFYRGHLIKAAKTFQISSVPPGSKDIAEYFKNDITPPPLKEREASSSIASPGTAESAVIFIGSATESLGNPVTNAIRLLDAQAALESRGIKTSMHFLFGSGKGNGPDLIRANNGTSSPESAWFNKESRIPAEAPFDAESLRKLSNDLKENKVKRKLWIQVGHGAEQGLYEWQKHGKLLTADQWENATYDKKSIDVLVGSPCYSGQFALAVTCGFFAAPPDLESVGCSENINDHRRKSYYDQFFQAMQKKNENEADLNGDGKISFSEAHWYSAFHMDHDEVPYTSFDALAEKLFEDDFRYKSDIPLIDYPPSIKRTELKKLIEERAPEMEKKYFKDVIDGTCFDCDRLPLNSKQKVEGIRKRSMIQMARRLYLMKAMEAFPGSKLAKAARNIRACEEQNLEDFLNSGKIEPAQPQPSKPLEYFCPYETEVLNKNQEKQIRDLRLSAEALEPGKIYPLKSLEFDGRTSNFGGLTILVFEAEWCGVCKKIHHEIETLAETHKTKNIRYFTIDVDKEPDLAEKFNVQKLPKLIGYKKGQTAFGIEGAASKEEYIYKLKLELDAF